MVWDGSHRQPTAGQIKASALQLLHAAFLGGLTVIFIQNIDWARLAGAFGATGFLPAAAATARVRIHLLRHNTGLDGSGANQTHTTQDNQQDTTTCVCLHSAKPELAKGRKQPPPCPACQACPPSPSIAAADNSAAQALAKEAADRLAAAKAAEAAGKAAEAAGNVVAAQAAEKLTAAKKLVEQAKSIPCKPPDPPPAGFPEQKPCSQGQQKEAHDSGPIWPWSQVQPGSKAPLLYWTTMDLGVFHYRIPGHVKSEADPDVVLHLFLKVVADNANFTKIWGQGFVEVVEGNAFGRQNLTRWEHLVQPMSLGKAWNPWIYLRDEAGKVYNFTATPKELHADMVDPWHLELTLNKEQAAVASIFQLRVDDWIAFYEVSLTRWRTHLLQRPQPPTSERHVVYVMSPLYRLPPGKAATLILHSLRYHLKVGVASLFIYARPGTMEDYLASPDIIAAISRGELRLVLWEGEIPFYDSNRSPIYGDQTIILSHAALAHHNDNSYLIFGDIDEFLVTFEPTGPAKLPALVGGLMRDHGAISLGRLNILCTDCYGTPEKQKRWPDEKAIWFQNSTGRPGEHPLHHYPSMHRSRRQGWRARDEPGKCIIDPALTTSWSVHFGYALKGTRNVYGEKDDMDPMPPLAFVHIRQMFKDRYRWRPWKNPDQWEQRSDWQWALKDL